MPIHKQTSSPIPTHGNHWLYFHLCSFSFSKWKWKLLSLVRLFATPWSIQFMELSRPELEWVALAFSRGSSQSRDWTQVSYIEGKFFTIWAMKSLLIINHWYANYSICLSVPSFLESRPTIPNALWERIKWNFLARMLYLDFFFIN